MKNYQSIFNSLLQNTLNHQYDNDPVNNDLVKTSFNIIENLKIKSLGDAFLVWAAFNYLNFAVKKNPSIRYDFKRRIEQRVYETRANRGDVNFYYEYQGDVLYISFYGFTFSFHNAGLSSDLKESLSSEDRIVFDGIRKQACATSILLAALKNPDASKNFSAQGGRTSQSSNHSQKPKLVDPYTQYTFEAVDFTVDELCDVFHLKYLTTSKESMHNIALVIREMYFYKDLVTRATPELDPELERVIYREIFIQTYSVIEAVEIEIGAMLKGIQRPAKHDAELDGKCLAELNKIINIPPSSKEGKMRKMFKDLRNNVHLSKKQSIASNPFYSPEEVMNYFEYMRQYLSYLFTRVVDVRKGHK